MSRRGNRRYTFITNAADLKYSQPTSPEHRNVPHHVIPVYSDVYPDDEYAEDAPFTFAGGDESDDEGFSFEPGDKGDHPLSELTSPVSPTKIDEINRTPPRSELNKFAWGAAFGAFVVTSQIMTYWLFSALPATGFGIATSSEFATEIDKMNFISESAVGNLFARSLLSYMTYISGAALSFGLLNMAVIAAKKRFFPSTSGKKTYAAPEINQLFDKIVDERPLQFSWKQYILSAFAFASFTVPNSFYVVTFKDMSGEAISMLPTIWGLYTELNKGAGPNSSVMNAFLNQWYAYQIILIIMNTWNLIRFIRKNYHKKGPVTWKNIAAKVGEILTASLTASLSFFFLTLNDKNLAKNNPSWMVPYVAPSAFIAYGLVLNTVGGMSYLNDLSRFWTWLNSMPEPLINFYQYWRHGGIFKDIGEWTRELAFYMGLNSNYAMRFAKIKNFPDPNQTEKTGLRSYRRGTSIQANESYQKPEWTIKDLKDGVERRIHKHHGTIADPKLLLRNLIVAEREELKAARSKSLTTGDIWKYGKVRGSIAKPFALIGPIGLSVVLLGYFGMINTTLTSEVYNDWFGLGLRAEDAASRMISFHLFLIFVKLVHDAGYEKMNALYAGTEHKIQELYHSWQVFRGHTSHADPTTKQEVPFKSSDFDYRDRFHPTNRKECGLFALNFFSFLGQTAAFLLTPPTAGTVIFLLNLNGYLNPATLYGAFFFTALFNSFGVAGFIDYGKQKLTQATSHWGLFRQNDEFFNILENPLGCELDIEKLTAAPAA